MKTTKGLALGFFVWLCLGMVGPLQATQIDITVDTAKLTITLLDGTSVLVTKAGEVIALAERWKGGTSGEKLQSKAVNSLEECNDQLLELKAVLEGVLRGESIPQHSAHTDAVLAKAAFEPVGKIVRAGATDEGIKLFAPLEVEISRRLTEIVEILRPSQATSPDCSSCGDPACCEPGSACCSDLKACPNGCLSEI
jgi:hypothetical protein